MNNNRQREQYFAELQPLLVAWRRDFHQHPEMAFQEKRTAGLVAERLRSFGLHPQEGIAQTGVVATLRNGDGPMIGLRADMDALPIVENNTFDHRSKHQGVMHACGHDGHTTMLLGAAKYLAEHQLFRGTVCFIFQPAEENEGGAQVMIDEGLFDQYPCESVFGMHNWPGLPSGQFAVREGAQMAAFDTFDIAVNGIGLHSSMPQNGADSVVAAAALVTALQSIVARNIDPQETAVVSVTQIHGGDTWNAIPETTLIRGSVRSLSPTVQATVKQRMSEIVAGIAATYKVQVTLDYQARYPVTINAPRPTQLAKETIRTTFGDEALLTDFPSAMASEDFGFMSQVKPSCYVWLGNGPGEGGCMLHNANYDFNDDALPIGAAYWTALVEQLLPLSE